MTRELQPLFSRRGGSVVAAVGMWLLGCAGMFYLNHYYGSTYFVRLGGYDALTPGQIGYFYLARFGAQMPALTFAAVIIAMSDFRRRMRAAFWIVLGLNLFLLGVRAARWPWTAMHGLDQSFQCWRKASCWS